MEIARLHVKSRFVLSARGGDVGRQAAEQPVEADETLISTWTTMPSRCTGPSTPIIIDCSTTRRKRSDVFGQTIRLAFPVSSSSVMKMTLLTARPLSCDHYPRRLDPPARGSSKIGGSR